MARKLTVLFRRDPSKDRNSEKIEFEGYQFLWPDGRPISVGLDAFCRYGQRVLGLRRHLAAYRERLLELIYIPVAGREAEWTKMPGQRMRRFVMRREGDVARVHLVDGTPTETHFLIDKDERCVIDWLLLEDLRDGDQLWFDFTVRVLEGVPVAPAGSYNGNGHHNGHVNGHPNGAAWKNGAHLPSHPAPELL